MTVSSVISTVSYAGNGSTKTFTVPFLFYAAGDLKAYLVTGNEEISAGSFTTSGEGDQAGGTITFVVAPPLGSNVRIDLDPPLIQTTAYTDRGRFPAESHERALDRSAQRDQALARTQERESLRALRFPKGVSIPDLNADDLKNKFLFGDPTTGAPRGADSATLAGLLSSAAIAAITSVVENTFLRVQDRVDVTKFPYLVSAAMSVATRTAAIHQALADFKGTGRWVWLPPLGLQTAAAPLGAPYLCTEIKIPSGGYLWVDGDLCTDDSASAGDNVVTNAGNNRSSHLTFDEDVQVRGRGRLNGRAAERLSTSRITYAYDFPSCAPNTSASINVPFAGALTTDKWFSVGQDIQFEDPFHEFAAACTVNGTVTLTFTNLHDREARDPLPQTFTIFRWAPGISPGAHTSGCGIGFANVRRGYVGDLLVTNCAKHCVDFAASTYPPGDVDSNYALGFSSGVISGVRASRAGDDNITTHNANGVLIRKCPTYNSSQSFVPNNSNCVEIDEGSENVCVEECWGLGCTSGIEVKGHTTTPAARNIKLRGNVWQSNIKSGHEIYHTNHDGALPSTTGYGILVDGDRVINPRKLWATYKSYNGMVVRNCEYTSDGTAAGSSAAATLGAGIVIGAGANSVAFVENALIGFSGDIGNIGLAVENDCYAVQIQRNRFINSGRLYAVSVKNGAAYVDVSNNRMGSGSLLPGAAGVRFYGDPANDFLSAQGNRISNYTPAIMTPNRNLHGPGYMIPGNIWAAGQFDLGAFSDVGASAGKSYDKDTSVFASSRSLSSSVQHFAFYNPNGLVGSISTSGSATSFATSSDETLKERGRNLDADEAFRIIKADPVWTFIWKATGENAVGWGAQTSYLVSRDLAVPGGWFGKDGNLVAEGADGAVYVPWGIDQAKRTPYLWAAVSRLIDLIEQLESQNAALEGRVAQLEASAADS